MPDAAAAPALDPNAAAKPAGTAGAGDAAAQPSQVSAQAAKPITYDLKLPDGSPLGADVVAQATALAQKLGLSPEHAQALLVENSNAIAAQRAAEAKQMADQDAAWQKQIAGDVELGGPKLAATLASYKRGFDAAPKDVQDMIRDGGLSNHPGFVRLFAQLGSLIGEDKLGGKPGSGAPATAHAMFPSMPNP